MLKGLCFCILSCLLPQVQAVQLQNSFVDLVWIQHHVFF